MSIESFKALAQAAIPGPNPSSFERYQQIAARCVLYDNFPPDRILKLLVCVEAAKAMRRQPNHTNCVTCESFREEFDTRLAALEE